MITVEEYFGGLLASAPFQHQQNAMKLLATVDELMCDLRKAGLVFPYNPKTKSLISGAAFGGYRPQDCKIGAANSSHKLGLAVDIYDPSNTIDSFLLANTELLEKHGIYIEHPDATKGWSHWSIKAPRSGKHVFLP